MRQRRDSGVGRFGFGCAVLAACALIAPPAWAATLTSHSKLTIAASTTDLVYGQQVTLSGRAPASDTVALEAQKFPFHKPLRTIATTRASASGAYTFSQRPTHAIRYSVLVTSHDKKLSTRSLTVYVEIRSVLTQCNLCMTDTAGRHTLVVTGTYQAPSGYIDIHSPAYFYYGMARGKTQPARISLVQRVTLHVGRYHRITFTVRYPVDFPGTAFRFAFAGCFKDNESKDGIGRPGRHPCGDGSLTRSQYTGYLG